MGIAALAVAALALLLALSARAKAAGFAQRIEEAEREARRRAENTAAELAAELATTRRLLVEVAAGRPLSEEMIVEGRLWREADPAEGKRLFEGRAARFVDVRTPSEVAQGKIPGALHIPLDDLEQRRGELPRDGRTTLIYCAGGGRSAAACDYLSRAGWTNLLNLEGGIQSWTGPVERP